MNEYNKSPRDRAGNQKQNKGQQRGKSGGKQQQNDLSPYLKALFDDLAPAVINYLNQAAESRERIAEANEKNARAIEKLVEVLPEIIQQSVPSKRERRKRKLTPRKKELLDLINKLRDEKDMTYDEIVTYLQKNNIPTFSGRGRWHSQTVHRLYMYPPA